MNNIFVHMKSLNPSGSALKQKNQTKIGCKEAVWKINFKLCTLGVGSAFHPPDIYAMKLMGASCFLTWNQWKWLIAKIAIFLSKTIKGICHKSVAYPKYGNILEITCRILEQNKQQDFWINLRLLHKQCLIDWLHIWPYIGYNKNKFITQHKIFLSLIYYSMRNYVACLIMWLQVMAEGAISPMHVWYWF